MIRIGVVGTSKISGQFIEAAKLLEECEVSAIYSRSMEKAKEFGRKYSIETCFDSLEELAKSPEIDMVYIASPNSLHVDQTLLMLNAKKHVLCEKPLATKLEDVEKMFEASKRNSVVLMEAMKSTLVPNYFALKKNLYKIGKIRGFIGNFCQYSSRYDELKGGKLTNIFNPEYGGGASLDLGVYPLYLSLELFGFPTNYFGKKVMLDSGVDGYGTIVLEYKDMIATLIYSKITQSYLKSEIQGELGSILIDSISNLREISIHYLNGDIEDITIEQCENTMVYELSEFLTLIEEKRTESKINTYEISKKCIEIIENLK